jgi:hypothetical protein
MSRNYYIWTNRFVTFYDFSGKKVWHGKAAILQSGLDISHLSAGVYFVVIQGAKVMKVVKIYNSLRISQMWNVG